MSQLNIQLRGDFEQKLLAFMAARGIKTKSEAVRIAVEEGLARTRTQTLTDWASFRGRGLGTNSTTRFQHNDDLWEKS